jgi:hypothetical protein
MCPFRSTEEAEPLAGGMFDVKVVESAAMDLYSVRRGQFSPTDGERHSRKSLSVVKWPLLADCVAKVVLPKGSKILRAVGAVFV